MKFEWMTQQTMVVSKSSLFEQFNLTGVLQKTNMYLVRELYICLWQNSVSLIYGPSSYCLRSAKSVFRCAWTQVHTIMDRTDGEITWYYESYPPALDKIQRETGSNPSFYSSRRFRTVETWAGLTGSLLYNPFPYLCFHGFNAPRPFPSGINLQLLFKNLPPACRPHAYLPHLASFSCFHTYFTSYFALLLDLL